MPPPPSAFLEQIIRFLMPFFISTAVDMDTARVEIMQTLDSYAARTRAELLNAAQIIAFSMSALDTLAEATAADLSPSLRLRFRGCANGLNRSTQQNESTLVRHLSRDLPVLSQPAAAQPATELLDDVPDHHAQAVLEQASAKIDTYRARLTAAQPAAGPPSTQQTERSKQLWAGAMMDTLKQMGLPNGA